jgi:hypothetical protein
MKLRFAAAFAVVVLLGASAFAHRLDEYLQATILSVEKDHVEGSMRLIPGVAVSSMVIGSIDTNADGIISETEGQAYARRVISELSLIIDGNPSKPRIVSIAFPTVAEMREGVGEIHFEFVADLPAGGSERKLVFENHHQERIAAYLVNCLVPRDKGIQVVAQKRNENQSFYELDYQVSGADSPTLSHHWWPNLLRSTGAVGFGSIFRLGMRHIAEGTDHLLFLLALLLPAPLLVIGWRWGGFAGTRHAVLQILKVVTAFTVGHSLTLALAAWGWVHVPSRPIEVLIAISILVSAVHALRPLFPGREAAVAGFFGLIHGLAFAATLGQLGLGRWERLGSILAFNLGIETMQLIVVGAIMPSLLLMSSTRAYPSLRVSGGLFAGFAALGWIVERLLGVSNTIDAVVETIARHAVWIAAVLFLMSIVCWLLRKDGVAEFTADPLD